MRKIIQYGCLTAFLVFSNYIRLNAQPPLPPSDGGTADRIAGAGAPVGSGTFILLTLAVAYGVRKVYFLHETKDVE
jgi:hypothetical protein